MSVLITLHILSVVIWIGGMFFAYMCLRPVAVRLLDPPLRLTVWRETFSHFFVWVWIAIILLIGSGHTMIAYMGGIANVGTHVHIMLAMGYVMIGLYIHVFFAPYKRMKRAVDDENWPVAGTNLNQIRIIVGINLVFGLLAIIVAGVGRYII